MKQHHRRRCSSLTLTRWDHLRLAGLSQQERLSDELNEHFEEDERSRIDGCVTVPQLQLIAAYLMHSMEYIDLFSSFCLQNRAASCLLALCPLRTRVCRKSPGPRKKLNVTFSKAHLLVRLDSSRLDCVDVHGWRSPGAALLQAWMGKLQTCVNTGSAGCAC